MAHDAAKGQHPPMNSRRALLASLGFFGVLLTPVHAQLVHLSFEIEAGLIFRANSADSPWHHVSGRVTKLDLYYDSQVPLGAWRDPSRNFWKMEVEVPERGREFVFARRFDEISKADDNQGLYFSFFRSRPHEDFELSLVFESPFSAEEGRLPLPPLPALGFTEYWRSSFNLFATQSFFPVSDIGEVYGGGEILSVTATLIPIPEPSTYAAGALLLVAAAVVVRRRFPTHRVASGAGRSTA